MWRQAFIFISLFVLFCAPGTLADIKEARISDVKDTLLDRNSDGYVEALRISVGIDVYMEGDYRIVADLGPPESRIYSYSEERALDPGHHLLYVDFPSQELYSKGLYGSIRVHVSLFSSGDFVDETNYTTSYIERDALTPPPPHQYSETKVSLSEGLVTLYNDLISVSLNTTRAIVKVGYTEAPTHSMVLTFQSLEILEDNGDGTPGEGDQVIVEGSLKDTVWELNSRFGDYYLGELTGIVPLLGPGGVQLALAQVSISFSSRNLTEHGYFLPLKTNIDIIGEVEGDFISFSLSVAMPRGYSLKPVEGEDFYEFSASDGGREFLAVEKEGGLQASLDENRVYVYFPWRESSSLTLTTGVDPTSIPSVGKAGEYLKNKAGVMVAGVLIAFSAVAATIALQWVRSRRG
ncbi:MAG: hypothetical protein J7L88_05450 [Thermoplasmata archaeon]|nr:hypothetical protein [Thermoplasmata archaeon]